MKQKMYEVVFEVTETCQNGKERRVKKSVYMGTVNEYGKHVCPEEQVQRGMAALREAQFYNITYIETKTKVLIFG